MSTNWQGRNKMVRGVFKGGRRKTRQNINDKLERA